MPQQGLAKMEQLYRNRSARAKELRSEGKKIVGYFCCLTPVELLTAADLVPYRIMGGGQEALVKADAHLETIACPYTRSCLDLALRGEYDFLDGFVMSHGCDNLVNLYGIWKHHTKPPYAHFINTPHTVSQPSHDFFAAELGAFKTSLERLVGRELTSESLNKAIELHNENRALVRELFQLRNQDPPLLSGSEVTKTMVAVLTLPVKESSSLLRDVIKDATKRKEGPKKERARLVIYGSEMDSAELIEMIEECGANVVMDDLSIGSRPFWHDVEVTDTPLRSISDRYLDKITCPRLFKAPPDGTHESDLENRFGHIRDYARDYAADGVILHTIMYCDCFAFDLPDVREFLEKEGLPTLDIEDEYIGTNLPRLKTRVEAFLEMIS